MVFIWIRPVCTPVRPSEVEELSDSAVKLLRALDLKFQPRHAGISHRFPPDRRNNLPAYQWNNPRQLCSQFDVRFNSNGEEPSATSWSRSFNFRPTCEENGLLHQNVNAPSLGSMGSLRIQSQVSPNQSWDLNQVAPPRQEEESSWEELSDIFEERNDGPPSDSSFKAISPLKGMPFFTESKSTSPMPVFSPISKRSNFLQTWPEPLLKRDEVMRLSIERDTKFPKIDDILTEKNNNHEGDENINEENDISLYESIDSHSLSSDHKKFPCSVDITQQRDQEECRQDSFHTHSFDSQFRPEKRIQEKHGNGSLSKPAEISQNSSPLFDRSFSIEEDLSQPYIASTLVGNDESFSTSLNRCGISDLFEESIKVGDKSKTVSEVKENLDPSSVGVLINPDKKVKKKFLGTPFSRAIRSSCLSNINDAEDPFKVNESSNIGTENFLPVLEQNNEVIPEKSVSINMEGQNIGKPPLYLEQSYDTPIIDDNLEISTLKEKIPINSEPTQYFPVFSFNNQFKRKCDVRESKSSTGLQAPNRKKLKFMVPYKKPDASIGTQESTGSLSTLKTIQELATKLSNQASEKFEFEELTEKLANNICRKIDETPLQETAITILYKEGFCQLNRSKDCKTSHPQKILLRLVWASDVQYLSITLQKSSWSYTFLKKILLDKSRKICFEAQEMMQLLVDKFNFLATEVASQWIFLDPLVGCWLLNSDDPPNSFKDVLLLLNLNEETNGTGKLLSKLSQSAEVLYESLTKFGLWKLFLHIEMRVTPILACMELHGIKVDENKLRKMASLLKDRLESVQQAAYKAAGRQFQLTSPQQLSAILYDNLKLHTKFNISVKETEKQHKSTSEAMLNKFKDLHPLPGIVLEFRGLHKLKSTYVDSVLSHLSGDSIYTTWDQISAATGRITSNEPNLQAIPKQPLMPDLHLRTAFVARNGYSFLAADFQHIELRVFAHLSKDAALINALSQKTDVFKILSKEWLQISDVENISAEDRDKTKRIVYALMYGAGASKLVEILQVDYKYACKILNKFSEAFPKMQDFTKTTLDTCRKQHYLATVTGRRRSFPHILSDNFQLRTHSERQAVNFLIQGMAADLCKSAMVHTQRHLASLRRINQLQTTKLLLQIHDELLWEVPDSELLDVTDVLQEAMEGATSAVQSLSTFSVPLPVVMKTGKTWGEMHIVKTALLGPSQQQ